MCINDIRLYLGCLPKYKKVSQINDLEDFSVFCQDFDFVLSFLQVGVDGNELFTQAADYSVVTSILIL